MLTIVLGLAKLLYDADVIDGCKPGMKCPGTGGPFGFGPCSVDRMGSVCRSCLNRVDPGAACLQRVCADDLYDDVCYSANCPVEECFGWSKETTPPPPPPDKCEPACTKGYRCVSNVCVFDETAKWVIRIARGTVSGAVSDVGSDPDPKVCLTVSGVENCTPEASNTATPVWTPPSGYAFAAMSAATLKAGVSFRYFDVDLSVDDPICSGSLRFTDAIFAAKTWTYRCTDDATSTFSGTLSPL